MKLEKLDQTQIESIVSKAIMEAVDFIEEEITPQRNKAQRYYDGEVDIGHEEGRSRVVATKCREVVRGIKPSIQRIFLTNDKFVEFQPRGAEDVALAEQMTSYVNYKFQQQDGYRILNDAMTDAMVKKTGIVMAYYDETEEYEIDTYRGLDDDAYTILLQEDELEVVEHTQEMVIDIDEEGFEVELPRHDVRVQRTKTSGSIKIESIPPEDFFVDRNARSIDDFYVCGHTADMRVADLLDMGFDLDELEGIQGGRYSAMDDEAEFERRGYTIDEDDDENMTVASRKIAVTNAFMELDINGTGKPRLYQFLCVGPSYKVLNFYEADIAPYAVFQVDEEPHAFFGTSLVDLVMFDQDAATSMLRGILDNVALTNNPALQIVDGQANVDDLLNNEIGRIVRVKSPQAVSEMVVPFTAGSTLPALQYFDQLVDNKTGVSKMAQGLDPDVLKSATATSVAASVEGQAGQAEVIARNLAEGGMRRLFSIILDLAIKNIDAEEVVRLNNQFVPVQPAAFDPEMDLIVNVGIGTGREQERTAAIMQAFTIQQQIYTTYGPMNGVVTLTQMRNAMADLLALGGIRNIDRYFQPMNEEMEQQMLMQQQQQQQMMMQQQAQQADPNQMFMQAEAMKAQTKAQVDMAKAQMDQQYKYAKLMADDDLERDGMIQDLAVKVAEILGKYGTSVDVETIKREQAADTALQQQIMGAMGGN